MRRRFNLVLVSSLVVVALLLLGLLAAGKSVLYLIPGFGPPDSTQSALLYPGAQNVKKQDKYGGLRQEVTFETTDPPETVLSYYRDSLRGDGWHVYNHPTGTTGLSASWETGLLGLVSMSSYNIRVSSADDQMTRVDISFVNEPAR